jgi:hypothetical protein
VTPCDLQDTFRRRANFNVEIAADDFRTNHIHKIEAEPISYQSSKKELRQHDYDETK